MTTRREFIAGSAALLGSAALGCNGRGGSAQAAAASAGPAARERIQRIGLELYTVRNEMRKDVAAALARVSQIGYKEVEFAGYFNLAPQRVRELLDQNGLTSPSVHTAIEILERDFAASAASAKVIGHRWLIVPSLNTRTLTSLEAWKGIATRFNALGKKAQDAGLRFAFHNHAVEPAPMADGTRPYDVLLGETDPATVDYQMDLYWMIKAGGDPLKYFAAHRGRFTSVHVKDGTPSPILNKGEAGTKEAMAQRDVGSGTIDFAAIFEKRAEAGIKHYYVEHDEPGADAFASVKNSHDYLAKLEFR
jgi:sugar phosphate isomerase/epimerase